jgi:hypothetical protein
MISFRCPACQRGFRVADDKAGAMAKCPCGEQVAIPSASSPAAPAPSAKPAPAKTPAPKKAPATPDPIPEAKLVEPEPVKQSSPAPLPSGVVMARLTNEPVDETGGPRRGPKMAAIAGGAGVLLLLVVAAVGRLFSGPETPADVPGATPPVAVTESKPAPKPAKPPRWEDPFATVELKNVHTRFPPSAGSKFLRS